MVCIIRWNTLPPLVFLAHGQDAVLCALFALLYLVSSSLLIHTKVVFRRGNSSIADWTCALFVAAGVFGLGCAALSVALGIIRFFQRGSSIHWPPAATTSQDIMMSAIATSWCQRFSDSGGATPKSICNSPRFAFRERVSGCVSSTLGRPEVREGKFFFGGLVT